MRQYQSHNSWQNEGRRPYFKRSLGAFGCVFVLFYLCFHAVSGDHGALALFRETRKLEAVREELAAVRSQHAALDRKVRGLSSNSLDLDMLDEQVRLVIGMAGKNEAVIFLDKPARK